MLFKLVQNVLHLVPQLYKPAGSKVELFCSLRGLMVQSKTRHWTTSLWFLLSHELWSVKNTVNIYLLTDTRSMKLGAP